MNASHRHRQLDANSPVGVLQLRVVVDVDTATTRMIAAGAEPLAPPTEPPWRSRNSRLDAPGPIHLTLFQELDIGAQP